MTTGPTRSRLDHRRRRTLIGLVTLALGGPWNGCAQYSYYGLTSTVEPSRFEDTRLLRMPASQRIRVATAVSICDGAWKQIYAIKNAKVTSLQRWRSATLLTTALGTIAIAGGMLANNRTVSVDSATGRVNVEDTNAARWTTALGLLTMGMGATGAFVLSMRTAETELDGLQALLPQIESNRATFNATLALDDPGIVDGQLRQLEDFCRRALVPLAAYDGDQQLAGLYGNEAVNALSRELTRKIEENERKRTHTTLDVVAAGRRFEALARALGYSGARLIGQPWQVGTGGKRVQSIPLRSLEPELRKLAAARSVGQISVGVFSADDKAPPAFSVSAVLAGTDRSEGTDAVLGQAATNLIAPAIDLDRAGGLAVVGSVLALAPYTRSVSDAVSPWLCRLRTPPLAAHTPGATTFTVAGCPPIVSPASPPSVASLRGAFRLPPLPGTDAADDQLLVRVEGLGRDTPGPALASLVWLEGKPALPSDPR